MQKLMIEKEIPNKEYVYDQLRNISMSSPAQAIIQCMVHSIWFDYCIILNQIMLTLGYSKKIVEKSLAELINLGLVKQQALFGCERTYIINSHYFLAERPEKRSREDLKALLTVHVNTRMLNK